MGSGGVIVIEAEMESAVLFTTLAVTFTVVPDGIAGGAV
jgi:hypothetical protein